MTGLLDTNVALYLLGGRLAEPLPIGSYGVSVITEMELLAWPSLTTQEENRVREFLGQLVICELTPSIRARAVQLRRQQHLKLPDAIVCATAMEFGLELWTK
jgi:predicted nucleic acid-binding protein